MLCNNKALIIVLIVAGGFLNQCTHNNKETIKVGAILPLTGPFAYIGHEQAREVIRKVQEINDQGGINGKPIELILEDNKGLERNGITALEYILLKKPMAVITAPLNVSYETRHILFSRGIRYQRVTNEGGIMHLHLEIYSKQEIESILSRVLKRVDNPRIGILYARTPRIEQVVKEITSEMQKTWREVVLSESYDLGQQEDVSSQLINLKMAKCDMVILLHSSIINRVPVGSVRKILKSEKLILGFPSIVSNADCALNTLWEKLGNKKSH